MPGMVVLRRKKEPPDSGPPPSGWRPQRGEQVPVGTPSMVTLGAGSATIPCDTETGWILPQPPSPGSNVTPESRGASPKVRRSESKSAG